MLKEIIIYKIKFKMKGLRFLVIVALGGFMFAQCGSASVEAPLKGISAGQVDSVSYAIGISMGSMLKQSNLGEVDLNRVKDGIVAMLSGKVDMEQMRGANNAINDYMQKKSVLMGEVKKKEQDEFMAKNKTKDGVEETESGLQYQIVEKGNEIKATAQDTVEVNYKGTLLDGTVFDSSYDRGESIKFPLSGVIEGWREGMQLVGEGGKINLWIPYQLAYGERSMGPQLPAYSTLYFEVEVIKVSKFVPKTPKKSK